MPLIKLYGAEDTIEAHLLKHMLEQRGVPVFITGEHLQGGAGELPAGSMVDVWVPDDFIDEAENVLDDFCESLDGPYADESEETDDELIGADGYYNDDIEPEDVKKRLASVDPENPWNRVYRKKNDPSV